MSSGKKSIFECLKISDSLTGYKQSPEHIKNRIISLTGTTQTPEHVENRMKKIRGSKRKIVVCPYCDKEGGVNMMVRWHFDNCKLKEEIEWLQLIQH